MNNTPLYFIQKATGTGTSRVHAKYLTVGGSILEFDVTGSGTTRSVALRMDATNTITLNSSVTYGTAAAGLNAYVAAIETILDQYGLDLDDLVA